MNNPEISIIVPVYKVEKYLNKCIDSILNQTFTDFELILVDDGSPDNCGIICDNYSKNDSRIKVIHKDNGGLSSARNAGIDIAEGRYINFIDSDDWIEKEAMESLYKVAIETKADIVQGKGSVVKDEEEKELIKKTNFKVYSKVEALNDLFNYNRGEVRIVAFNKLYSKELFKELRYPEGKIHEDEYLTPRLIYKANKVIVLDSQLYNYRLSENSIMRSDFNIKRLDKLYVLKDITNFYKSINEYELKRKADIIYTFTLIEMYSKVYKNIDNNRELLRELKNEFNKYLKKILYLREIDIKKKLVLIIFKVMPKVASVII